MCEPRVLLKQMPLFFGALQAGLGFGGFFVDEYELSSHAEERCPETTRMCRSACILKRSDELNQDRVLNIRAVRRKDYSFVLLQLTLAWMKYSRDSPGRRCISARCKLRLAAAAPSALAPAPP